MLNSIDRLVLVMEEKCVVFEVESKDFLNLFVELR